jgi:hypothetical protein
MDIFQTLTWRDVIDNGLVIAGSPDTVAGQMEELAKSLRVGTVFCLQHMGDMADWKTRYSTQLFAEKVMPRLKDIWSEYDGSKWWCKPLDDRRVNDEASFANARRSPEFPADYPANAPADYPEGAI